MRILDNHPFQGAQALFVTNATQDTTASGTTYSGTLSFPLSTAWEGTNIVGPGTVGLVGIYACSGASARTIDTVAFSGTYGTITGTELGKVDGVGNCCALYAIDLSAYEEDGSASVTVDVTLSGTITNGLAFLGVPVTGIDWPLSYNAATVSTGDPMTANVTYNARGVIAFAATSNNTTGGQSWFSVLNGVARASTTGGLYLSNVTYSSRTHCIGVLSRYASGQWDGLETLSVDSPGTFSVGVDYSSDGVSETSGTVSNPRLIVAAID